MATSNEIVNEPRPEIVELWKKYSYNTLPSVNQNEKSEETLCNIKGISVLKRNMLSPDPTMVSSCIFLLCKATHWLCCRDLKAGLPCTLKRARGACQHFRRGKLTEERINILPWISAALSKPVASPHLPLHLLWCAGLCPSPHFPRWGSALGLTLGTNIWLIQQPDTVMALPGSRKSLILKNFQTTT